MTESTSPKWAYDVATVIKDRESFKDWFVRTYFREFGEIPTVVTKVDIDQLVGAEKKKEMERTKSYLNEIVHVVSESLLERDVTDAVLNGGRHHDVVLVRKVSLHVLCTMLKFPKPEAAELLGKDRTTVLHHCKAMNGILKVDRKLRMQLERILVKLDERGLVILRYRDGEGKIFRKK
jgi:chromosomal replication initiation ATPase DnaA